MDKYTPTQYTARLVFEFTFNAEAEVEKRPNATAIVVRYCMKPIIEKRKEKT
jgi:hypothetical protein